MLFLARPGEVPHSGRFDLTYWDPLTPEDGTYTLTVDPDAFDAVGVGKPRPPDANDESALIPPVDVAIRTRWPCARVDWNDDEPIL